jgi:hypothetical protein
MQSSSLSLSLPWLSRVSMPFFFLLWQAIPIPRVNAILHAVNIYSVASPQVDTTTAQNTFADSLLDSSNTKEIHSSLDATGRLRRIFDMVTVVWIGITSAILLSSLLSTHHDVSRWMAPKAPFKVWSLIHAFSAMIFSGTIIVSAIIEGWIVALRIPAIWSFWYQNIPALLQACLVGPALTGSVLSGAVKSTMRYGSLRNAPKHILNGLHALNAMALWWLVTDLTTQSQAIQLMDKINSDSDASTFNAATSSSSSSSSTKTASSIPAVLKIRQVSNVVSCLLLFLIYALMVLKPGNRQK